MEQGNLTARSSASKQLDNVKVVVYNVKASIRQIETWDDVKSGYLSLLWYICFVLIFITILSLQLNVGRAFTVDYALREVVLEQTEKLDGVRSMEQVWTYLIGEVGAEVKDAGLMAKLFQEQWYNGDEIDPAEAGYVLDHNKLVGGVLLVQQRGAIQNCSSASVYTSLYPDCYTGTRLLYLPPLSVLSRSLAFECDCQ